MLDKTQTAPAEITEKDLGLGIQFARQIGTGQITLTAGVPLDYKDLNGLLDKLAGAMDRQAAKGTLDAMQNGLDRAKAEYATAQQQLANFEAQVASEWEVLTTKGGRRGPVKWTESQLKQKLSWQKQIETSADRIRQFTLEVKDAEAKCR